MFELYFYADQVIMELTCRMFDCKPAWFMGLIKF